MDAGRPSWPARLWPRSPVSYPQVRGRWLRASSSGTCVATLSPPQGAGNPPLVTTVNGQMLTSVETMRQLQRRGWSRCSTLGGAGVSGHRCILIFVGPGVGIPAEECGVVLVGSRPWPFGWPSAALTRLRAALVAGIGMPVRGVALGPNPGLPTPRPTTRPALDRGVPFTSDRKLDVKQHQLDRFRRYLQQLPAPTWSACRSCRRRLPRPSPGSPPATARLTIARCLAIRWTPRARTTDKITGKPSGTAATASETPSNKTVTASVRVRMSEELSGVSPSPALG